jgi:hypothetical protein
MLKFAGLCLAVTAVLQAPAALAAGDPPAGGLAALQGAWVQPSAECADVFVKTKRGMAYKHPVSIFAPALLITGKTIRTPGAVCKVGSIKPTGDKQAVKLACTTMISTDGVDALLSVSSDGDLFRYTSEDDHGTRYVRCGP